MSTTAGDAAVLQSSRTMAIGTVLSRVTGLIRTVVLAMALGTGLLASAFNAANTLPNIVYELLLGGVLTSVLVPLLVRAAHADAAEGEAFARQLLSAVIILLAVVTVVMVALAPQLMQLYLNDPPADTLRISTAFARFFLPQIFFYGVGATLAAILNTRGSFAAPMWAPVLNNLLVIATLLIFLSTTSGTQPRTLTDGQVLLLGIGTTAGIVLQTVALLPSLRRVGFRIRLTARLRGAGLGRAVRLGAWTLVYVAANQLAYLVVVNLATALDEQHRPGYAVYVYAFLLFSLPHAVVAVSVISALLPQMSRHAADGRTADVARDLARGTRLAAVVLVPAALLLAALNAPIAQLLFGHRNSAHDAGTIGVTLAFFAIGLVPFSAFQLQLRAFYSLADTRTPALINIVVNVVNVAADLALYAVLPPQHRLYGLAAGYALSYVAGWVVATRLLRGRLGRLGTAATLRTIIRLAIAGIAGAGAAWLIATGVHRTVGPGLAGSLTSVLLGSAAAGGIVVLLARRLRVAELDELVSVVTRRGR
ncbi:MAG: integral rane protein MviN [Frankiales bacterium]|nr:integral rane protein MviN [Frankiales bacterium]